MERKQVIFNFKRFYVLLKKHPHADKRELVYNVTNGETDDLKLLTEAEYRQLCNSLDDNAGKVEEWRRFGSTLLSLLQEIGVNTRNWTAIDNFLKQPRIYSGICDKPKNYIQTTTEERQRLIIRLHSIINKANKKEVSFKVNKCRLN